MFRRAVPHVKGMVTGIAMFVAVLIVDVVRVLTPQAFPTWTADVPWSAVALALAFLFAVLWADRNRTIELRDEVERLRRGEPIFDELERLMPDLLAEMQQDLDAHPLMRECVLLKKDWVFNGSGVLTYYFEDHPDLTSEFQVFENHGLVSNVTATTVARYRISEDLAKYLRRRGRPNTSVDPRGPRGRK